MADRNKSLQSGVGSLRLLIITVIGIIIAWIIGKGILMLVSSVKQV